MFTHAKLSATDRGLLITGLIIGSPGTTKLLKALAIKYIKDAKELSSFMKNINKLKKGDKLELTIKGTGKKVDDILKDAKPGRPTKGPTTQYEMPGGFGEAKKDFYDLKPRDVEVKTSTKLLPALSQMVERLQYVHLARMVDQLWR